MTVNSGEATQARRLRRGDNRLYWPVFGFREGPGVGQRPIAARRQCAVGLFGAIRTRSGCAANALSHGCDSGYAPRYAQLSSCRRFRQFLSGPQGCLAKPRGTGDGQTGRHNERVCRRGCSGCRKRRLRSRSSALRQAASGRPIDNRPTVRAATDVRRSWRARRVPSRSPAAG